VFKSPLVCWDARQQPACINTNATCLATMRWAAWAIKLGFKRDVLWTHPMAEVLSPDASMQSWSSASRHSSQILTAMPMNSRRLLIKALP
jgi:hypothetical protein